MPLKIIRQDITKMRVDAIVNAADRRLLGGGGVDGAIHRAAGPGLLEECRALGGCEVGQAKITGGHRLPCRYVIHTVGPKWHGGGAGEAKLLALCYSRSMQLAQAHGCTSIAFPLISSGAYGYPKDQALRVATDTIRDFLLSSEEDMMVYLVVFDPASYRIGEALHADIAQYIDDAYAARHTLCRRGDEEWPEREELLYSAAPEEMDACSMEQMDACSMGQMQERQYATYAEAASVEAMPASLDAALAGLEDGFSQLLLAKIDERGMTDVQCYKKANIDRKLFSKIRSDRNYKPSKYTVIAFAIALELGLDEARDMLARAGFALSHASKFDIIIEYFISHGIYDIFTINEALFAFDQPLLGA